MTEIIWYFSFSDLFYLVLYVVHPSMLLQMIKFHSFFYGWVILHCICVFTHLSINGYLNCFHSLAIVNIAAMNMGMQISFQISVFLFFWKIPSSIISGSCGNPIFNFLRNLPTVFYSGAPVCSPISCGNFQRWLFLPSQYFLLIILQILAILTGVRWYFIVLLNFISVMISDVEHLFTCLLAIWMSTLVKMSMSSAHF